MAVIIGPPGGIGFTKYAGKVIVCSLVKHCKNMKFFPVVKGYSGVL